MKVTWQSSLPDLIARQIPFAIQEALNDVAREAADAARAEAAKGMTIRNRSLLRFFIRAPREFRATKTKHSARVIVAGPKSDPNRGSILTGQETGKPKTPTKGRFVAIPARDARSAGVSRLKRGTDLKTLGPFRDKGKVAIGAKNTVIVTAKSGARVLLQRQKGGRARVLWLFTKYAKMTKKLGFSAAVYRTVNKNLQRNLGRSLTKAIASARRITSAGGTSFDSFT